VIPSRPVSSSYRTAPQFLALGLLLLTLASAGSAVAGPWVPDPGHGYAKAWVRWLPGVGYFPGPEAADQGVEGPQLVGAYHEVSLGLYGEYGLCRGIAVVAHWNPVRTFLLEDTRDQDARLHVSTGEPRLGVRVHLAHKGRFTLAAEGNVTAPLSPGEPVQPVYSALANKAQVGQLRTATGVWEVHGGLAAGLGLDALYLAASVGAIAKSAGFDSVVVWTAEGGRRFGKRERWQARLRLQGYHPLGDGSAAYHSSPSGLGNGTHYVAFTLEADYELRPGLMLGLSVAGGVYPVLRQSGGPVLVASVARVF